MGMGRGLVDSGLGDALNSGMSHGLSLLHFKLQREAQAQRLAELAAYRNSQLGLRQQGLGIQQQRADQGDTRLQQGDERIGIMGDRENRMADQGQERIDLGRDRFDASQNTGGLMDFLGVHPEMMGGDGSDPSGTNSIAGITNPHVLAAMAKEKYAQDQKDAAEVRRMQKRHDATTNLNLPPGMADQVHAWVTEGASPNAILKFTQQLQAKNFDPNAVGNKLRAAGVPDAMIPGATQAAGMHAAGVPGASIHGMMAPPKPAAMNLSPIHDKDLAIANTQLSQAENHLHSLQSDYSGTVKPEDIEHAREVVNAAYTRKMNAIQAAADRQKPAPPAPAPMPAPVQAPAAPIAPTAPPTPAPALAPPATAPTVPAAAAPVAADPREAALAAFTAKHGRAPNPDDPNDLNEFDALSGAGNRGP